MSPFDCTPPAHLDLADLVACLQSIQEQDGTSVDLPLASQLLSSAVRLYVQVANEAALDQLGPLTPLGLTPTDAVVTAAVLLRDQDLTAFDLAIWFQRARQATRTTNNFEPVPALSTDGPRTHLPNRSLSA